MPRVFYDLDGKSHAVEPGDYLVICEPGAMLTTDEGWSAVLREGQIARCYFDRLAPGESCSVTQTRDGTSVTTTFFRPMTPALEQVLLEAVA